MLKGLIITVLLFYSIHTSVSAQPEVRWALNGAHLHGYVDKDDHLCIYLNGSNTLIGTYDLTETDAKRRLDDKSDYGVWRFSDLNFDGYEDVLYSSNSGNVQQFEEVYLYRPKTKTLLLHGALSAMPCLSADIAKKEIKSTCNHSSAAENWSETYKWENGVLIKIAQEGTMPVTENGEMKVIEYRKVRRGGKWVFLHRKVIG